MVRKFKVKVNNKNYEVEVEELNVEASTNTAASNVQPAQAPVQTPPPVSTPKTIKVEKKPAPVSANTGETVIESPMAGLIVDVRTSVGAHVKRGDVLIILEAMKMENNILSSKDGIVKAINVSKGQEVEVGAPLIIIE
jgi:biotin carboxyl carrier protein